MATKTTKKQNKTVKKQKKDNYYPIDVELTNREDGTPMICLFPHNKACERVLNEDLEKARLLALPEGKSDSGKLCDKKIIEEGRMMFSIPLALGGVEVVCLEKACQQCLHGKCKNTCKNK